MEIFTTIVTFITSLPTAAFTGIVMGLMCVVFRGGMKNAVRACCCFMVGIAGITLNVIDGGYGAIPYYGYVELLFPALACIIVLDIIMIGLGWTKVLWVDIHNTWHGLFVGLIAYAITDDYVLSLIITVIVLIILLKLADFVAPRFQEFNNTPGVCCIASSATMAGLFTCIVMKVIDKIPGLNSIKFSAEDIQDRFGIFGEQIVLGAIIGLVLGLCAGFDITGILYLVLISYIATWMAPAITMGIEKSGLMADTVGNGALLTCWDEGGSILAGFVRMLLQLFGIAQI